MTPATPLDTLLSAADRALRALFAHPRPSRPLPTATHDPQAGPQPGDRALAGRLMRVNHAGEVAAQALYHGQALVARDAATRDWLLEAAREEADHLAWCEQRLDELDSRPSLLNPFWYAGSFAIGAVAAAVSDRVSLGFVAETERQVESHLTDHLERLPADDARSRAILEAMRADEVRHGARALREGGVELPAPVRAVMRRASRVMTRTAYWI
ncbi:MAG: 2-polyprenyl-3-methyl-6-methoxy-1,4-benzoquinone monooxygenase [Steroidobacteraceae bacterium]